MKTNINTSDYSASTYALLIRSEEKNRNIAEAIVYALFTLCVIFSIWHAAQQPIARIDALTQRAPLAQASAPQPTRA